MKRTLIFLFSTSYLSWNISLLQKKIKLTLEQSSNLVYRIFKYIQAFCHSLDKLLVLQKMLQCHRFFRPESLTSIITLMFHRLELISAFTPIHRLLYNLGLFLNKQSTIATLQFAFIRLFSLIYCNVCDVETVKEFNRRFMWYEVKLAFHLLDIKGCNFIILLHEILYICWTLPWLVDEFLNWVHSGRRPLTIGFLSVHRWVQVVYVTSKENLSRCSWGLIHEIGKDERMEA